MNIHPSISKEAGAYMGTARDLASALLGKPRARQSVHVLTKAFGGGLGTRYTVLVVAHGQETGEYFRVNERTLEALKQGASPAYLERNGRPGHPSDLAAHTVWAYRYFVRGDEWPFDGPDGRVITRIRPTVRTNNGDTCRAGALAGHCIVLQPSFLVGPDIRAGRLVEIMPDYQAPAPGIYAVYPSRRHVAPKVRLLIDFLMEAFRKPEWAV